MKPYQTTCILISLCFFLTGCPSKNSRSDKLILADASIVWWMAPAIIAKEHNLYSKNNVNVRSFSTQTGLASMNAVLSGDADVGLVATSPLSINAFKNDSLVVLCSYIDSKSLIAAITPKSAKNSTAFLQPVAVVKNTISEFYLYNYLKKYSPEIDYKKLNKLNVMPANISNTILKKSAQSAVIWEPFATLIANKDSNVNIVRDTNIYDHRIYIVTRRSVLRAKSQALIKFVTSIGQACSILNTEQGEKEILDDFPLQKKSISELYPKVNFSLKFDFEKMKTLILADAQTAYELGITPKNNAGSPEQLSLKEIKYFDRDFNFKP